MRSTTATIVVVGVVLLGCKQFKQLRESQKKADQARPTVTTAAPKDTGHTPQDDADAELGKKLDGYLTCINTISGRATASRRRYLQWVDPARGPTGKERSPLGLYALTTDQANQCKQGITSARSLPPALANLDQAGQAYAAALVPLVPLTQTAHDYYDQKKFLDDKFAQGKSLHKPLMAAFEAFSSANDALHKSFEEHNDALAVRLLAHVEKTEGKNLTYHNRKLMLDAKLLVRTADAEKPESIDAGLFGQRVDAFEASLKNTEDYAVGHATERRSRFPAFAARAKEYLKACRAFHRRIRDKTAYTSTERLRIQSGYAEQIEGHPAHLLKAYNELVDGSNSMNRLR